MKRPALAALLNFFFMGAGTAYNGQRVALGLGWTVAAILLTAVEQGPLFNGANLQTTSPTAFGLMFVAVFLANSCFAVDAYREAKALNARR